MEITDFKLTSQGISEFWRSPSSQFKKEEQNKMLDQNLELISSGLPKK